MNTIPETFDQLEASLVGTGHPSEPLYDAVYSPSSRMPATDFSPWIIHMFKTGRPADVVKLVSRFIGMPNSAERLVATTIQTPYESYLDGDETFFRELRSTMLVLSMRGSVKGTTHTIILRDSLFVHRFRIKPQYQDKAFKLLQRFINQNNRQYMGFTPSKEIFDYPPDDPTENPVFAWLKQVPASVRCHFITTLDWMLDRGNSAISLQRTTDYTLREFGINITDSCRWLRESGYFSPPDDLLCIAKCISAEDLPQVLAACRAEFNPRSPKKKIIEKVQSIPEAVEALKAHARSHELVCLSPAAKDFSLAARAYSKRCAPRCEILAIEMAR